MTKNTQAKPLEIKLPKSFEKIMEKWGVKLRPEPVTVTHLTYKHQTVCSPSVYAAYEVAIKANFVSQFIARVERKAPANEVIGCLNWYQACLTDDEELPFVPDEWALPENANTIGCAADDDYRSAVRLLIKAGLSYELLD